MGRQFICDAHIPPKLLTLLRSRGHDGLHATSAGLDRHNDIDLWRLADRLDAILVSKDSDFVSLNFSHPGPRFIFVSMGNCSNDQLLRRLDESLEEILRHFDEGFRFVELTW